MLLTKVALTTRCRYSVDIRGFPADRRGVKSRNIIVWIPIRKRNGDLDGLKDPPAVNSFKDVLFFTFGQEFRW